MRLLAIALLAEGMGGCHNARPSAEPIYVTKEVDVPVSGGACVPATLGPKPQYVDSTEALRAAVDPAERFQLVIAGRAQRDARLNEIEPIIDACPREKGASR